MPLELDWNLISIIIFYSLIAVFLYIKRKKISVESKIILLYRTERFNKFIHNLANKCPKFWRWFGYVGIPIGFVIMALIFSYLTYTLIQLFVAPSTQAAISLVIPGVKIPGQSIFVPFWYGIISLFVVILVHEGSHGIVSEAFKNKIKSSGVGLLAILPLAFVEPNEEKLKKQPAKEQLAIFAAGPFANFFTAGIVLLLATFLIAPLANAAIQPAGLIVDSVTEGQPAAIAGLPTGVFVNSFNGNNISKADDFSDFIKNVRPGQTITLVADNKSYSITTKESPSNASKAFIGINLRQNYEVKPELEKYGYLPWIPWHFLQLLYWIFVLNLGIGAINLLPLGPIDGGRMAYTALEKGIKEKEKAKKVFSILSALSLALLLANLIGPYIMKAL